MKAIGIAICLVVFGHVTALAQQPVVVVSDGQAAAVVVSQGAGQTPVRDELDPQDPVERFLLLAPTGPLVIQVSLTIDGQPFNVPRESLIDQMIKLADTDGDGVPTWKEALANPRFGFGGLRGVIVVDAANRDRLIAQYDRNKDGRADRAEVRRYLAQTAGGPAFNLATSASGDGKSAVRALLDADHDLSLNSREMAEAADRLAARDADGNDVITAAELGVGGTAANYPIAVDRLRQGTSNLLLLGPAAQWEAVASALAQQYGATGGTAHPSPLLRSLDANGNGQFERDEVATLNTIEPHLALAANFVAASAVPSAALPRVSVTSVAAGLGEMDRVVHASGNNLVIELPGLRLELSARPIAVVNSRSQAQALFARGDADKNGYIEKSELTGNQLPVQLFDQWDADQDGKVYLKEVEDYFDRQSAPQRSQITASANIDRDPLLSALDTSSDGRLGLRELRAAEKRLAALDKNGDGALSPDEVPLQLSLVLTHGGNQFGGTLVTAARMAPSPADVPRPLPGAPEWFTRMDRNGDGDLSPREFLGTAAQFKKLDADGDGLIDLKEAQAGA